MTKPDLLASAKACLQIRSTKSHANDLRALAAAIDFYSTPRDVPDGPGWWWMIYENKMQAVEVTLEQVGNFGPFFLVNNREVTLLNCDCCYPAVVPTPTERGE